MGERTTQYMRLDELQRAPRNAKAHSAALINASLGRWGIIEQQTIDERTGALISGHGRLDELLALRSAGAPVPDGVLVGDDGMWLAPVSRGWASVDDLDADAAAIALNRIGEVGGWESNLSGILDELATNGSLEAVGYSREDFDRLVNEAAAAAAAAEQAAPVVAGPNLADRFLIPPFSLFDARQGYWLERKRRWLALGIRSEEGRPHNALKFSEAAGLEGWAASKGHQTMSSIPRGEGRGATAVYHEKAAYEREHGPISRAEWLQLREQRVSPNRSMPSPPPAFITERMAPDQPGSDLWNAARAELRRAVAEAGWSNRQLDELFGFNGMAGHWLGDSQPILPSPDQWRVLSEHLTLDPALWEMMTDTVDRPPSEGSVLVSQRGPLSPNRSTPNSHSGNDPGYYWKKQVAERRHGGPLTNAEFEADYYDPGDAYVGHTSIFDPVLCEVAYRWWSPTDGRILDPFAGGSVRGIVAGVLGRSYIGVDVSARQVEANREQAAEILAPRDQAGSAEWVVGDSLAVLPELPESVDFVFSCPPYFDLERYSDDPADLSNAGDYDAFLKAYREIIRLAVERLAPDRFACFVVGDIRAPDGSYRGFVADTIAAFEDAGCAFYNDIVLVTAVGSLALRAAKIFSAARKVGKAHQNVLVFCKGDAKRAAAACAPVDTGDLAELFAELLIEEEPASTPAEEGSPGWTNGLPLDQLREAAALFRDHDGDLPLGAFSAVKEATVADWQTAGSLQLWRADGALVAGLVATTTTRPRHVADFAGRDTTIPIGVRSVRRMAARPGYEQLLVDALTGDGPLALEVWQEHPLERWVAAQLALGWQATKIKASSELVGVYLSAAPDSPPAAPDGWALVRLAIPCDAPLLLAEVEAAAPEWADHYAVYNKRRSWQAVALRGYGGDPTFIIKPAEMSKAWKAEHADEMGWQLADSPLYDSLPLVRAFVDSIPGAKHRVRLMRLAPGNGELTRHADITDPDAGSAPGRLMRLHFPLLTNPQVLFRGWQPDGSQQQTHMAAGEAWWLDTRKPHTARNDGPTERIHLVVDVESSPELLALIAEPAPVAVSVPAWEPGEQQPAEPWAF